MRVNTYSSDRSFSDIVHDSLALNLIYPKLNWEIQDLNAKILENIDLTNAVDYVAIDKNNMKIITIQERFREVRYSNYNDFTIRYKREFNQHEERKLSEYFKLDVDYFVYGIIDRNKHDVLKAKKFIKFCIININEFKNLIDQGKIKILENTNKKRCYVDNKILICPVIQNYDFSSSFFPVDIVLLMGLFKTENVVLFQEGFL